MKSAFSLVELSIVLVILGLLVGGVLSGQSLIRAAEMRKLSSGIAKYQTALASFKDKYFALPGDMTNAASFWGTLGGGGSGSGCFTLPSSDTKTCNGDGNGQIGVAAGSVAADNWYWGERFHVWNHLANAGLIEGSYTGVTDVGTNFTPNVGKNIPSTGIQSYGFDIYNDGGIADGTSPYYFSGFSRINPILNFQGTSYPLTPAEAWNIDTKFDDGKPGSGKIWSFKFSYTPCADSDTTTSAKYSLTNTDKVCNLLIQLY